LKVGAFYGAYCAVRCTGPLTAVSCVAFDRKVDIADKSAMKDA